MSTFLLLLTPDKNWFRKETLQTAHEGKKEPCMSRLAFHFLRYLDRDLIYMLNFHHFVHNPHRFCSSLVNEHSVVCLWKDNKNEERHKRYLLVLQKKKLNNRKIQKSKNNESGFFRKKNEKLILRQEQELSFLLWIFFLNVNKTCLFCLFVRWKTNTCRLAFFPSARNKQLDILDSYFVFKVRSQSCLESSSTVHQDSIFRTSSFSFLSLQLLCCCRWAFPSRLRTTCTRNRFHGNDAQW